jgi:hypothetical protein
MYKNATVAQWYKTHGKHEIYAKGKKVDLNSYEHSLRIDEDDAARIRHLEHDIPQTAAEEDRIRRRQATEEAAKVRKIYEELVLKKQPETVIQIGSVAAIKAATPTVQVGLQSIAPATNGNGYSNGNGNGNGNGHGAGAAKPEIAETVAGD